MSELQSVSEIVSPRNIIQGIHNEQDRVREMIAVCKEVAPKTYTLAVMLMEAAIKEGNEAIESMDAVKCVLALTRLRTFKE